MSLLLGALAGAGAAYQDVADRHIANYDNAQLEQMKAQAELLKEQRQEESKKRLGLFQESLDIRSEKRGLLNSAEERRQKFTEETDPENVRRAAEAKTTELGLLDSYKYGNADKEAAYKRKLAEATRFESPDRTDYTARELDHELKRLEIEQAKNPNGAPSLKGSKVVKVPFGEGGETRDVIMLANGEIIDPAEIMQQKELSAKQQAEEVKLSEADATRRALFGEPQGEKISREELILDLEKRYPNMDVRGSVEGMSDDQIVNHFNKIIDDEDKKKSVASNKSMKNKNQQDKIDKRLVSAARQKEKGKQSRYFGRRED